MVSMFDLMYSGSKTCDICGRFQEFVGFPHDVEQESIEKHGWHKQDGKDVCKICAPSGLRPKEEEDYQG